MYFIITIGAFTPITVRGLIYSTHMLVDLLLNRVSHPLHYNTFVSTLERNYCSLHLNLYLSSYTFCTVYC